MERLYAHAHFKAGVSAPSKSLGEDADSVV